MEFFRALIDGYGMLILTILGAMAIIKAALVISKDGLRKALSRGVAFVATAAALAYLVNPFLNWLFIRTQANVGQNLFAQSAIQLTKDTASIIENAQVSGKPIQLDTSNLATVGNTAGNQSAGSGATVQNSAPAPQNNTAPGNGQSFTTSGATYLNALNNAAAPPQATKDSGGNGQAFTPAGETYLNALNGLTGNPGAVASPTPHTFAERPDDGGGPRSYTVKPGDSLAKIAQRFGVSVAALCQANSIRNCNVIAAGKVLSIP